MERTWPALTGAGTSLAPLDELVTLFRGVAPMKTCPQCGREIDGWDGVCRFCADKVVAPPVSQPEEVAARPIAEESVAPKAPAMPKAPPVQKAPPAKRATSWQLGALV